jgi:hypothetical protein
MKVVFNNIIPTKGFKAITLWPWIFVRRNCIFRDIDERHEMIHCCQQKEMLIVFFYLWYGIEWLYKLCKYRNATTAYKNISFEREAYSNQNNVAYLDERKPYAFLKYLTKNN